MIRRANFLFTGYLLTDTQILCSLIALKTDSDSRGKLLQVATGEGKSTIVCILAIIHALKNKQVHVITSSPVLAERDSKEKKLKLFKMFHLTCSDNNDKTVYLHGRKDCYKSDIVYGEVSQFQFDTLRDQYGMLGTLGKRRSEIAIVDEVDSMLIDDSSKNCPSLLDGCWNGFFSSCLRLHLAKITNDERTIHYVQWQNVFNLWKSRI